MRVFDMRRFSNLRLAGLLSVAMLLLSLHSMAEPSAAVVPKFTGACYIQL